MDDTLSIVILVILIGLSAFFSASETAFSTVNRIRLKNYANNGDKKAKRALKIGEDYDRALSAILIGNNIVNIASASIGTIIFTTAFGPSGLGISTLVMTILVLIFGEILPKTFAKENSEKFCLNISWILSGIMWLLTPLNIIFVGLKNIVSKKFKNGENKPSVTEEELKYIIEEIEDEGVLEEHESELIRSALDFDEITVNKISTPRVDVVSCEINDDIEKIKDLFLSEKYSRIPVYEKTIDNIVGVISEKVFLCEYLTNKNFDIRNIMQTTSFVPPTKKISELLKELQKSKTHLSVVTDQYGGTIGIITMEDILEELVGEIWDEQDEEIEDYVILSQDVYEVNGDMNVYDFLEDIEYDYSNLKINSNSINGWILEILKKIPEKFETFNFENLEFTITEIEEQRILKVKIKVNK